MLLISSYAHYHCIANIFQETEVYDYSFILEIALLICIKGCELYS